MTNGATIDALRATGLTVKVWHHRPVEGTYFIGEDNLGRRVVKRNLCVTRARLPKGGRHALYGGYTTVSIDSPDGRLSVMAEACCRADEQYNRGLGLTIALGRAMSLAGIKYGDLPDPQNKEASHGTP